MDTVLRRLDFVFCYIDDILIASSDEQEHAEHLRTVFQRLQDRWHVYQRCTRPLEDRVAAILNYPKPKTVDPEVFGCDKRLPAYHT